MKLELAREYDAAATWCAKRGIAGKVGDPLPDLLSSAVCEEIRNNPEEFELRVRECAYGLTDTTNGEGVSK